MSKISDPLVESWRNRIIAAWAKYGDGKPLDPEIIKGMALALSGEVRIG